MKKVISISLAAIMTITTSISVFGGQFEQGNLKTAFDKTKEKLVSEYNFSKYNFSKYNFNVDEMMKNFAAGPLQTTLNLTVNDNDQKMSMNFDQKADAKNNKSISSVKVAAQYGKESKSIIDNSLYINGDVLALKTPKTNGKYFSADLSKADNIKFLKDNLKITDDDINQAKAMASLITSNASSMYNSTKYNAEGKKIVNSYKPMFASVLKKVTYTSQGITTIKTVSGDVKASMITVDISKDAINKLAKDLSTKIQGDKDLKALLNEVYGASYMKGMLSVSGMTSEKLTDQVISTYVDLLQKVNVQNDVYVTAYINEAGYIARTNVYYYMNNGKALSMNFDLLGSKYLFDNTALSASIVDTTSKAFVRDSKDPSKELFNLSMVGNNVYAKDGKYNNAIDVKISKGDQSYDVKLTTFYDAYKFSDNFTLNCDLVADGANMFSFTSKGDLTMNTNSIYMSAKSFVINVGSQEITGSFDIKQGVTSSDSVTVPASQMSSVLTLTGTQIEDLLQSLTQ